jgi:hypothetical protein
MADKDRRALDQPKRSFYRCDILFRHVEAVLGGYHPVPLRLKSWMTLL